MQDLGAAVDQNHRIRVKKCCVCRLNLTDYILFIFFTLIWTSYLGAVGFGEAAKS